MNLYIAVARAGSSWIPMVLRPGGGSLHSGELYIVIALC
jgi:hypothetical protein